MAIHGGAGTIRKAEMTPDLEQAYQIGLETALLAGHTILEKQGTALDAVEAAVRVLEDNPLFNAGRGSVYATNGRHEMEASIMCGQQLDAGAVAMIQRVRHPISLARTVLKASPHVLLVGAGAETFAREHGLRFEAANWFDDPKRWAQLQEARQAQRVQLDHAARKMGTVGAVALDLHGNLAAATSTGGMTNKMSGRIGDSPLIGSGTYANNATCAVSCTGIGEFMIRGVSAYDVSCLMAYRGLDLAAACHEVIQVKQTDLGGEGGLIAVDAKGEVALVFNSEGMYRAWIQQGYSPEVWIYA